MDVLHYKAPGSLWGERTGDELVGKLRGMAAFQGEGAKYAIAEIMKKAEADRLRGVGGWGIYAGRRQESLEFFQSILQRVNPQAYAAAMQILQEETGKEVQQTQNANVKLEEFAGLIQRSSSGLDVFSDRLLNWKPPGSDTGDGKPKLPGRAFGGRVLRGMDYIGGERGMELFTPDRDGWVTPNNQLRTMPIAREVSRTQASTTVVHHHHRHDNRRIEIRIDGSRDPEATARAVAYALEIQQERA